MNHPKNEMIDLNDLRLFMAVARAASFVRASRRTKVPTSTVSRAVARLEQALGVRLLQRTSRTVASTHEGELLLRRVAPLLDELDDLLERMTDDEAVPAGRLRVTAPVVTGSERIGRALIAYAAAHPRLSIELLLTNSVLNLVEEGIDLAFRAGPIADAELVARKLWSVPYALGAAPAFVGRVLGGRKKISAERLAKVPAVVTYVGVSWRFRRSDGSVRELTPNAQFTVSDPRVALDAAKAGLGVVRAPRAMIARERGALSIVSCELGEPEGRELFAVYPSRKLLPARVKGAIEWVLRDFVENPPLV